MIVIFDGTSFLVRFPTTFLREVHTGCQAIVIQLSEVQMLQLLRSL